MKVDVLCLPLTLTPRRMTARPSGSRMKPSRTENVFGAEGGAGVHDTMSATTSQRSRAKCRHLRGRCHSGNDVAKTPRGPLHIAR